MGAYFHFNLTINAGGDVHDSASDYTFTLLNSTNQFRVASDPLGKRGLVLHRSYQCCGPDMDALQVSNPDLGKFPTLFVNQNYSFTAWVQLDDPVSVGALWSSCYSTLGLYISPQQSGVAIAASEAWSTSFGYFATTTNTTLALNQWYHVAVTFQAAQQWTVYVNGQAQSISVGAGTGDGQAFNHGICLGSLQYLGSPTGFRGFMDQVSVQNRLLSAADVAAVYSSTLRS